MSPAERLKAARVAAGYKFASKFADAFGFTESTYRSHENGTRGLDVATARQYAAKLGVAWESFFVDQAPAEPEGTKPLRPLGVAEQARPYDTPEISITSMPRDIPVYGSAQGGEDGAFEFNAGEPIDFVRRPPRLAHNRDAYAVYMVGNSMSPWREAGQIVYAVPHLPVLIGDYVTIQVRTKIDGEIRRAFVKRLVKRSASEVVGEQFNPAKRLTFRNVESVHKILDWSELLGI